MRIDILLGGRKDIETMRRMDPGALAVVLALLQEAEADPKVIDKFTTHGDVQLGNNRINVKGWVEARRTDNLFRIRILDTSATSYRVVYGYDWRRRRIGILGIVHKDNFDYGITSTLANRILNDWRIATGDKNT